MILHPLGRGQNTIPTKDFNNFELFNIFNEQNVSLKKINGRSACNKLPRRIFWWAEATSSYL